MVLAKMKPTQAMRRIIKVDMNIHLLPRTSLKYPTGTIVDPKSTPMKKLAPMKPILDLLSQRSPACSYQFSMYAESDVSA